MLKKCSKSQFKAHALEMFREIEATGEALVITDNGTPTLEIRPYQPHAGDPLEKLRGSVKYFDNPPETVEFFHFSGAK